MTVTPLTPAPAFRGRIGRDPRSGHYAVPRRYRLHLAPDHDDCLRIAVVHGLLGLDRVCPVTVLDAVPDCSDGGHSVLRPLYEASAHRYRGPAVAPVLSDHWSGRIVSTHARDIMRDLARYFTPAAGPVLYPAGAEAEIEGVELLCARTADPAALPDVLDLLERRLTAHAYVLGDRPTAADVEVWVALVRHDSPRRAADHPALWSHVRRLTAHPAFGRHLAGRPA
ncbi:glutathione S-transferase C-terminal domain-containing protein [Streptomyces lancefieldiae]|uniref:Glutathione S-transferase C-terminal domain-containing protein n=1 Tax=Streptomyces lancefieldiae TaxID=3075520 RepID=A0ABU3AFR7_9ACTN|nr:glutathione S-transferase C-terminal domain-containing protein [Streptomyces sp. DSM 40712]MDT0609022.1 glutathione S-transferase C-terminal domain-containing protein [Streptomyces sp. DSM 40712]